MNKKIAILQSNYIPWKGVFDLIHSVDIFVFLDDVQYTEHDWRNRNKIKMAGGTNWLTVPVINSKRRGQLINEAEIDNRSNWQRKHYNAFQMNYGKSTYYTDYKWILDEIYLAKKWEKISELNQFAIKLIAQVLGIETLFLDSVNLDTINMDKNIRILEICKQLGGNVYRSGPSAKDYIDLKLFEENGIEVEYISYDYPSYEQRFNDFDQGVSVLDLIFNCGKDSSYYIWGWRNGEN